MVQRYDTAVFGVHTGAPRVDLAAVVERKDRIVEQIRTGAYQQVTGADNLDLYQAEGRFTVDGTHIDADRIFLITGLRTTIPPIDGLDRVPYHTSRTLLDLRELPQYLAVVGGGYIGCEFAQMFRRFGAQVTIVQRAARLLPAEDPDISTAVTDGFTAEGIDVRTNTTCVAVDGRPGAIRVGCADGTPRSPPATCCSPPGAPPTPTSSASNTSTSPPDEQGFLSVDDMLHTPAEDVWALGDIRGGPMFTHTARDDADIVYRTVFRDQNRATTGRIVPHAVFVDPEVAAVGMTEPAARATGNDVVIGRQDFTGVVKARAIGNTRGLIKIVADGATGRILGCHIAGPDAGDLIHEAVIAMTLGASYRDLARAIHIHPTLAEGVNAAAGGVHREVGT